ncbi:TonB-dependent receptor [Nonlabens dokdonensis]|uniref:TonB-dependent receptor n=1 Tax=Nonlabens dokdonensis TaxID=328515 RepID=A0A1Z8AYN0_9FLAO|nr:outer membrane beta-barrel family protein [Nonlabens dokdonensis]OUS15442.1 TonB-dependent receptor [Nonlabens dokdonensis]
MKYLQFFIFILALSTTAQNDLTGSITNNGNEPLAYSNVVLFKMPDSVFYKASYSDEKGKFKIANCAAGAYTLQVSSVGYVPLSRKLTLNQSTDIGAIILNANQEELDAVVVNAARPSIDKRPDRLIFNVENTVLSTGNTQNLLKNTPGVFEMEGTYMVQNSPAVIYINNKRVYLTSEELDALLKGYSADNIKSVEVITNPPASYDAEGVAVININTSKGISLGYKGNVNGQWTQGTFSKYQIGTSHFYKNDWLNVYANYNYNPEKNFKLDDSRIGFFNPDGTRSERWFSELEKVDRSDAHNFNTIVDITVNDKNSLSFSGNLSSNQNNDVTYDNETLILQDGSTTFTGFDANSLFEKNRTNGFVNAQWQHSINETGSSLSLEGNYIFTDSDQLQNLNTTFFDQNRNTTGTNSFLTDAFQEIDIYTAKLDYNTTIGSYDLSSGLKFSNVTSTSSQDFFDTDAGTTLNPALSDLFLYDETIFAAYAQVDRYWEKWSLTAGLRVEQTDVEGDSRSLGQVNTQEYLEFFPNLALTNQVNENNSYTLSYKRTIDRPRYSDLNPFSTFLNDFAFNTGNPNLQPAFNNKFTLSWNHQNTWFVDAYFLYTKDLLSDVPFQNNSNNTLNTQSVNLNYELQYSIDAATFQYINNSWYTGASASLFYMENETRALQSGNVDVVTSTTGLYLNSFNRINLAEDRTLSMDVDVSYISSILFGTYEWGGSFASNLSFNKSLWDRRAQLTLKLTDIFNTQNQRMSTRYLNQDNSYLALPETRTISIGFTYNFGNFRLENNEVTTPEEQERISKRERGL